MLNKREREYVKKLYDLCNGNFSISDLVNMDEPFIDALYRIRTWYYILDMYKHHLVKELPSFDEFVWGVATDNTYD